MLLRQTAAVKHISGETITTTAMDLSTTSTPLPRHHRWKVLGVDVAANASSSTVFSSIPTTAVFIHSTYHLGNTELGVVLNAPGLSIAINELPWGLLTDRWGDHTVLLAGLGLTALALFVVAYCVVPLHGNVSPLAWLVGGILSVGLLGGSVNGSSGRTAMDWLCGGEWGLAMSVHQITVPLGGGIGTPVLPTIAVHAGLVVVYGILVAACALTAVLMWLWVYDMPDTVNAVT